MKRIAILVLILASSVLAQQSTPALRGTWTATAGSKTFRGSWGAGVSSRAPDVAQGWWRLLSDSDEILLEGTWSARKTASRWHGTWAARVAQCGSFSGTWDVDLTGSKDKTLADMLARTFEKEICGSWQSGRAAGNWWLRGAPPKKAPR